jgi:site-specific DNA recombinase
LTQYNIDFVSVKERFDTSSPAGKAMLMMCSTFAQFERDTIAERIRDNMLELAKTGRWLGGITPIGFISEKLEKLNINGKKTSLYKLSFIEDEINVVNLIFSKFIEFKSQQN